jgi:hypothetical protein
MVKGTDHGSGRRDGAYRTLLAVAVVPSNAASSHRARTTALVWVVGLVGVVAIGLAGHLPQAPSQSTAVTQAAVAVTQAAAAESPSLASNVRGASTFAPPSTHRSLGDDGLVGGIVFGDNVPRLDQAGIERDGYRFYRQQLDGPVSIRRQVLR